ncbi:MAG: response regulator [Pseudomonadota bacterium]
MARRLGVDVPDDLRHDAHDIMAGGPGVRGTRVLIADDDALNRQYLEAVLAQYGVQVSACADGAQAVRLGRNIRFDAIFLDARMPVCSGEEAARQLRDAGANTDAPIIALTASALDDDRRRLAAAGFDECLIKPAPIARLLAHIGRPRRMPAPSGTDDADNQSDIDVSPIAPSALAQDLRAYRTTLRDATLNAEQMYELAHRTHGAAAIGRLKALAQAAGDLEAAARVAHAEAMALARKSLLDELDKNINALDSRPRQHVQQ